MGRAAVSPRELLLPSFQAAQVGSTQGTDRGHQMPHSPRWARKLQEMQTVLIAPTPPVPRTVPDTQWDRFCKMNVCSRTMWGEVCLVVARSKEGVSATDPGGAGRG